MVGFLDEHAMRVMRTKRDRNFAGACRWIFSGRWKRRLIGFVIVPGRYGEMELREE